MHHGRRSASAQRAFTLIELMIVVAVAAVLALIAVPSYMDSVRKGRRADAMAGLMRWQQLQERFRGNEPTYASTLAALQTLQTGLSSDSSERHYTLSIDAAGPGGYTMSATAKSSSPQFADTKCRKLTVIMANGAITTTSLDASNADTTATARCWVK
jgi:type IV pilus assembly protein PilE